MEMESDINTAEKVEVKVGSWDGQGYFTGQVYRFTGEEVASYTELHGQFSSGDDRGTDTKVFKVDEDSYRVYIETWSRWQGEGSHARLLPNSAEDPYDDDPEYGRPIKYGTYTEAEVRERYPEVFAASGDPNVIDLD
jgi:hypothetical protein